MGSLRTPRTPRCCLLRLDAVWLMSGRVLPLLAAVLCCAVRCFALPCSKIGRSAVGCFFVAVCVHAAAHVARNVFLLTEESTLPDKLCVFLMVSSVAFCHPWHDLFSPYPCYCRVFLCDVFSPYPCCCRVLLCALFRRESESTACSDIAVAR